MRVRDVTHFARVGGEQAYYSVSWPLYFNGHALPNGSRGIAWWGFLPCPDPSGSGIVGEGDQQFSSDV